MEMMTHLEGPIVDSLYDMSLLSWAEAFKPPLPLLKGRGDTLKEGEEYKFADENQYLKGMPLSYVSVCHIDTIVRIDIYLEESARINKASANFKEENAQGNNSSTADIRSTRQHGEVSAVHRAVVEAPPPYLPSDTTGQFIESPYKVTGLSLIV